MAGSVHRRGSWLALVAVAATAVAASAAGAATRVSFADYALALGEAPDGSATVLWAREARNPDYYRVNGDEMFATRWPAEGPPGAPAAFMTDYGDSYDGFYVSAVTPDGGAVFAWDHLLRRPARGTIQFRRFDPSGRFGPVVDVARLTRPTSESGVFKAQGLQGGSATLAWLGDSGALQTSRLEADGSLGPVRPLAPPDGRDLRPLRYFVGFTAWPDGNAVLTWPADLRTPSAWVARQFAADGVPGATFALGDGADTSPLLVPVPDGGAWIASISGVTNLDDDNVLGVLSVRHLAADGVLGPPIEMDTMIGERDLLAASRIAAIALDTDGSAVVAWVHLDADRSPRVLLRRVAPDSTVGPKFELGIAGSPPSVTVTAGRATVVWQVGNATLFRQMTADGPVSTLRRLGSAGHGLVAAAPDGTVTAVWGAYAPDYGGALRGRRITPDGQLGPLVTLSPVPITIDIGHVPTPQQRCVRSLRIPARVTVTAPDRLRVVRVRLDGRTLRRATARALTIRIPSRQLRPGRHRLRVEADSFTASATTARTFQACR